MAQGTLKIHTENLLPIIKKWLYSEKDIFIRELVSNGTDALRKLKMLSREDSVTVKDELSVHITIDKEKKTIKVTDTGIGMTAQEVEKYIAQLAFSGAEEFLEKYHTKGQPDPIIGHFGLGFYSVYMVAKNVEIQTLSYQGGTPVFWTSDGGTSYKIEKGNRTKRGTEITLYIDNDSEEFLDEARLKNTLLKHCSFFPYPIFLNDEQLNKKSPLWLKPVSQCTDQDYLEFYKSLYPLEPDPLFWVHLNIDYPFNLKGILYFPKIQQRFDWNQNTIKLFCNRVFVSDDCKGVIPEYLMMLKGAIDSPDIPLNVSRSSLQIDKTVKQLSSHIAKKIADRLLYFYQSDRQKFLGAWPDIEVVIKLGVLQDEKFYERVKGFLVWKNLSKQWTTLEEYISRHKGQKKVFYTSDPTEQSHLLSLYKKKNLEVLLITSPIDTTLMSFLEKKLSITFQRIDGALDENLVDDQEKESTVIDNEGNTQSTKIADLFRSHLKDVEIEAKGLAEGKIPCFLVIDEQTRRMKEFLSISTDQAANLPSKHTLVVNTNNPLIKNLYSIKDPTLIQNMVLHLYELAQLSHRELHPDALSTFINRSSQVLEKLVCS